MPDDFSFDFSEVDQLAVDLGEVPKNMGPFINSALQFTAKNVKKDAASTVSRRRHFKQAASAIDYDVDTFQGFGVSVLKVEVGYDKGEGPGNLGNLVEYGSPGDEGTNLPSLPPGNDLLNALEKNQGDFEKGLGKAAEDAEKGSRL